MGFDPTTAHLASLGVSFAAFWAAFAIGLVQGFTFCIGMCGPVVGGASMADGIATHTQNESCDRRLLSKRPFTFQLTYHLGRLGMLALLGTFLGYLGQVGISGSTGNHLLDPATAVWLRALAGTALTAAGIWLWAGNSLGISGRFTDPSSRVARMRWFVRLRGLLADGHWGLPLGALMALLPCAPLLMIGTASLLSASPAAGAIMMLAFGLGTMPALMSAGALGGVFGVRAEGRWLAIAGASVVMLGLVTLGQAVWLAATYA
jgi:hypothetical protein